MSDGPKIPLEDAASIALTFIEAVQSSCQRIEVAGSVRRKKALVGDIEIVCLPWFEDELDMFGCPIGRRSLLDEQLQLCGYQLLMNGEKMKQVQLERIKVDLFVQLTPATWGVNFTLRTGSADFSRWLVTSKRFSGAMPGYLRCEGCRLWNGAMVLDTPEEMDVFNALGLKWVDPEFRQEGRWRR